VNEEVLAKLQNGDHNAFETIFKAMYAPLCSYARLHLSDSDEAEEIVQTILIKLWEKRKTLDIKTNLNAYLYAAVKNHCLNQFKHQKVRKDHAAHHLHVVKNHASTTDELLSSKEIQIRIDLAVGSLPDQCRNVFVLSREHEMKYSEIAEKLGISIKTVEAHMGKALKILRDNLKDYLPYLILFFPELYHLLF
jgi:RNA polymerase sigma-70 factor, ECF subfamily